MGEVTCLIYHSLCGYTLLCVFSIVLLPCPALYLIEEIIVEEYFALVRFQDTGFPRPLKIEYS